MSNVPEKRLMNCPDKYDGLQIMKNKVIPNTTIGCVDSPNWVHVGIVALSPRTLAMNRPSTRKLRACARYRAPSVAGVDESWKKTNLIKRPANRRPNNQRFCAKTSRSEGLSLPTPSLLWAESVNTNSKTDDNTRNDETSDVEEIGDATLST